MKKIPETLEAQQERFAKYVDRTSSPKGCHLWTGALLKAGYGRIKIKMPDGSVETKAHRIAFIWKNGPVPDGKIVCHVRGCATRACVNDAHLYAGTYSQNNQDAIADGSVLLGEKSHSAKLSNQQKEQIRLLRRNGKNAGALAKQFSVHVETVRAIVAMKPRKRQQLKEVKRSR